jgi:competence protein ComEC
MVGLISLVLVFWASGDSATFKKNLRIVGIALFAIVFIYFSAGKELNAISVLGNNIDVGEEFQIRGARVLGVKTATSYKDDERRYKLEINLSGAEVIHGTKKISTSETVLASFSIPKDENGESDIAADLVVKERLIGKKIQLTLTRGELLPATNPNLFDYEMYLKTQGIRIVGSGRGIDLLPVGEQGVISYIYNSITGIKYKFADLLYKSMSSDNASLLFAMLFGDKDALSEEIYSSFQRSSVTHIICVSGIHMGMVYALVLLLCGKKRTVGSSFFVFSLLFLYAMISEFTPSIMRALVMIIVSIISRLLLRRYDMLTSIAIAIIIFLLINPLYLYHSGAILSFFAVASLATVIPFISRYLHYRDADSGEVIQGGEVKKRLRLTMKNKAVMLLVSLALPVFVVQISMSVIVAYMFTGLSLAGLIANIPVVWLAGITVPMGVVAFVIFVLANSLQFFLGTNIISDSFIAILDFPLFCEDALVSLLRTIPETLSKLPFSYMRVAVPRAWMVVLFYFIAFFGVSETRRLMIPSVKKAKSVIAYSLLISGILLIFLSSSCKLNYNSADLTFLDVGQGDALHIKTPDGRNYLFDGGGKEDANIGKTVLYEYFLHNGISRLDGVFISHLHTDHFKGARELSVLMDVGPMYIYDGNRIQAEQCISGSGLKTSDLRFLKTGDRLRLGRDTYLDVLYPDKKTDAEYEEIMGDMDNENANSLVLSIDFYGVRTLMTGDIDETLEAELLERESQILLGTDILKIAHHGSRFSSSEEFIRDVKPDISTIQVGRRNTYGHPTKEVLDRLEAHKIPVYRNDIAGAIMIDIDKGKRIRVKTMLNNMI